MRVYVEAARQFFNRDKAGLAFSLGITDGAGWCECQQCRALDRGETFRGRPVTSDRYYTFVNQVAREVAKTLRYFSRRSILQTELLRHLFPFRRRM